MGRKTAGGACQVDYWQRSTSLSQGALIKDYPELEAGRRQPTRIIAQPAC